MDKDNVTVVTDLNPTEKKTPFYKNPKLIKPVLLVASGAAAAGLVLSRISSKKVSASAEFDVDVTDTTDTNA